MSPYGMRRWKLPPSDGAADWRALAGALGVTPEFLLWIIGKSSQRERKGSVMHPEADLGRSLVEQVFNRTKQCRPIATRYNKLAAD